MWFGLGGGRGAPGRKLAEFTTCTPASLPPSKGVTAPWPAPKHTSSPLGSANRDGPQGWLRMHVPLGRVVTREPPRKRAAVASDAMSGG